MMPRTAKKTYHFLREVAPLLSLSLALCGFVAADVGGIRTALMAPAAGKLAQVVGVSVGVAPNEFNSLAQGISQMQEDLNARERDLAAREALAASQSQSFRRATILLGSISFILLILILLNYYADWRRRRTDAQ